MSKLHELLAVESDLRSQAESCRTDLKNTFEKKRTHFMEKVVTFKSMAEGVEPKVESQLGLQTTVGKELDWIGEKLVKAINAAHQIDMANISAVADVVLEDGTILLAYVPAMSLLQLEKRIKEIQDLVSVIPTLDPAQGFELDASRGSNIFRARDIEKSRTEKKFDYVIMVQPTDKFPAQVKELNVDKVTGYTVTQEWSSLITVAQKGDMLDRTEELLRAVKQARARANSMDVDVKENKIAQKITDYVFDGKI